MADKKEVVTVVAELQVSHDGTDHIVKSFDKAWHLGRELGPVSKVVFLRWARKDPK